jgi:two-component system, sensor histidine kinase RpfC
MREVMSLFSRVIARWRERVTAGDRQMAVNRLAAGVLVLVFNIVMTPRNLLFGVQLYLPCSYILAGWLAALHMLAWPRPSATRRVIVLVADCCALSLELHIGGAAAAWLFALYLWTISGYGYRFGSRFQICAMVVAASGFCTMAVATPYWRDQPSLVLGGLICLTAVPLYAIALIRNLSQAQRQAEEANRAKSLFLTSVSHELRTPLNAVIGMGALLESSELSTEQLRMSQTITTAARSLLSLINGILEMSRIEVGALTVAPCDFDLAPLLNEIRTIFVTQGRLKGVQLNMHVTARTPLLLRGDARKLHEILLNLVGNAIKFTKAGSITVAVDMVARHGDMVRLRFEVADTGIGIAAEAHERIFEMFTQADDTVVNRFGGTGLGLALVRKAVQLLGGEIGVQSQPGMGSTFWFELPLHPQAAGEDEACHFTQLRALVLTKHSSVVAPLLGRLTELGVRVEQATVPPPGWPVATSAASLCLLAFAGSAPTEEYSFVDVRQETGEGLPDSDARLHYVTLLDLSATDAELANILHLVSSASACGTASAEALRLPVAWERLQVLVADDNATNRYVTEKILISAGHSVTLVNNGEDALDALAEQSFDIAVLDVNMPLLDGIETAKIYRMTCMGATPVPLIALTADATAVTRERCLEAGMAACLVKPVEPARLLATIDEVLQKARGTKLQREQVTSNPRVTEISSHPRFRSNLSPAADVEILDRLRNLGGDAFLSEVCDLFRSEAQATMQELHAAAKQADVPSFRAHAHALRSVAANVGARQLYEICQPAQNISSMELRQGSHEWLEQVGAELRRVDIVLADYCAGRGAQSRQ